MIKKMEKGNISKFIMGTKIQICSQKIMSGQFGQLDLRQHFLWFSGSGM